MLTLGIETSGLEGAIALRRDGVLLQECRLRLGQRHAQTLVPEIQSLFEAFGHHPRECDLVGVSLGPGSFTGLRVGIVCAKVLAYAIGCRIRGVETLRAIAANAPATVEHCQAAVNAQRQELFVQEFQCAADGEWRPRGPAQIIAAQAWVDSLQPADCVTGPGLEPYAVLLAGRCRVLDPSLWRPSAARIAILAEADVARGAASDVWQLEPLYLRKSAAEEKWDRTHGC